MNKYAKLFNKILQGHSEANIPFADLCQLLLRLGFTEHVRGSHHLFRQAGITEKVNLQTDNHHAKPYQVRQVRQVILKYHLRLEE